MTLLWWLWKQQFTFTHYITLHYIPNTDEIMKWRTRNNHHACLIVMEISTYIHTHGQSGAISFIHAMVFECVHVLTVLNPSENKDRAMILTSLYSSSDLPIKYVMKLNWPAVSWPLSIKVLICEHVLSTNSCPFLGEQKVWNSMLWFIQINAHPIGRHVQLGWNWCTRVEKIIG